MPLDLRSYPAGFLPTLRLIAEAGVAAAHLMRRLLDWALEQVFDPVLQDPGWPAAGSCSQHRGFEKLVRLGIGKGGVGPENRDAFPCLYSEGPPASSGPSAGILIGSHNISVTW
jgi:hypothetical protein